MRIVQTCGWFECCRFRREPRISAAPVPPDEAEGHGDIGNRDGRNSGGQRDQAPRRMGMRPVYQLCLHFNPIRIFRDFLFPFLCVLISVRNQTLCILQKPLFCDRC